MVDGQFPRPVPPSGPERDFGELAGLLDEFLFFSVGIDGIVIDPERAYDSSLPCRCVDVTKANGQSESLCWHAGLVGLLTQEQEKDLCKSRIPLRHPQGVEKRIEAFERASSECKGMEIEKRLECMSRELRKNGVVWGEARTR